MPKNYFMMNEKKLGLRISGTIFGIVALIHLLRILTAVPILVGSCSVPIWINWLGLGGATFLFIWLWRVSASGKD
jgi:hypothetical protein